MQSKSVCVFTSLCWFMTWVSSVEMKSEVKCIDGPTSDVRIHLTCPTNDRIHVKREIYGNRVTDGTCRLNTTDGCTRYVTSDKNDLVVNCNGRQDCTEYLNSTALCDPASPAFKISYDCVEDSLDMCSTVNNMKIDRTLHLHSPGFPDSVGVKGPCQCNITGAVRRVFLIEHRANLGVLEIMSWGKWNKWFKIFPIYNNTFKVSVDEDISIGYDNNERRHENIWIKVTGFKRPVNVNCKGGTRVLTSTTSLSAPTVTPSATTVTPATVTGMLNETTSTNIVILAPAVCGGTALLLVVVLLVYCKVVRPYRIATVSDVNGKTAKRKDIQTVDVTCLHYENVTGINSIDISKNGGQQGSHDMYSDISRHENIDSVHEYGKLHVYGNTCS